MRGILGGAQGFLRPIVLARARRRREGRAAIAVAMREPGAEPDECDQSKAQDRQSCEGRQHNGPGPAAGNFLRCGSRIGQGDSRPEGHSGCGGKPGENECKGKGECGVPMSSGAWKKARARFEELMKKEGKEVGPAPPKGVP